MFKRCQPRLRLASFSGFTSLRFDVKVKPGNEARLRLTAISKATSTVLATLVLDHEKKT